MSRWKWYDKMGAGALAGLAVVGLLYATWRAFPTARYIIQDGRAIVQDEEGAWWMTSVRRLPYGSIRAKWQASIRVLHSDKEGTKTCQTGVEDAFYEVIPGDTATYRMGSWALDCLEEGPPLVITYSQWAVVLGLIRLPVSVYSFTVQLDDAPIVKAPGES